MAESIIWQPLLVDVLATLAAAPEDQLRANGPGYIVQ
jgi:hypothetical protein